MAHSTEDDRYRQSTQFRLWSYSPSQLADLRAKTNSLARQNISERLSSSVPVSATVSATVSANPSGSNTPIPVASGGISTSTAAANVPLELSSTSALEKPPPITTLPDFLTPAEEELLLRYYTVETLRAAEFCALPTEIRATAAVFLRRFFVTHSVMTYPPAKMLKTCVFFGCKAENYYPRVRSIAEKFPNTTGEEILAGEFLLCQGIRFAFDVRHPFGSLEGAMMQLRSLVDLDEDRFQKVYTRAREILKFSPIVTDAYFHYTPSQIMLAALLIADVELFDRIIDATFGEHPTVGSGANTPNTGANGTNDGALATIQAVKDKTVATIKACRDMLLQEPPERMTEFWGTAEANNLVKPLNKKLRKCRDPDRFDLIGLHKKRLEFREKEAGGAKNAVDDDGAVFGANSEASKGDVDREPKRLRVAGDDPFGPPL